MNAVLALARPEIVTLKPYAHAAWLPSLTRLHANEAPWRPAGDTTGGRSQSLPRTAAPGADRTLGTAVRRSRHRACSRRAAATKPSTCCRASTCVPAPMPFCNARRPSACTRWRRAFRAPRSSRFPWTAPRGWALDPERLLSAWQPNIKLVYLCSPNNPTANLLDAAALEAICTALDGKAIVVIDEAYIEWSRSASLTRWLDRFSTLAILRTLSKAHALAGARVGALAGTPRAHRTGEAGHSALLPGAAHGGGGLAGSGAPRTGRRPGTARRTAGGAGILGARPRGLAAGGEGLAERRQLPAHRLPRRRSLHEQHPGRRYDRSRSARPPAAAAFAARLGGHARAKRYAASLRGA